MGFHKEKALADAERKALNNLLQTLLDTEMITGDAARGITKKVIDEGEDALVGGQKWVYKKHIAPFLRGRCKVDGAPLTYEELWDGENWDVGTVCHSCLHDMARRG